MKIYLILAAFLAAIQVNATTQPNILFIVSEDNSEHMGCYGEKRVHTPALDSLAKSGIRYTRAYVPYSVCSPSRAAFLTGLYTRQTGHIGLASHKFSFYKDFKTMPSYFQDAGYYTGFLGKIHVNPEHTIRKYVDHQAITTNNFGKTISIEKYAAEAKKVMQDAAKKKKPFMLIINYADAHRKFVGKSKNGFPSKLVTKPIKPFPWIGSDSPHLREEIKNYFNCMNRLDEAVGMVLKDMDELKVRDNTLIIYIADHGADFPRGKGSVYESGIRIPMIVNYPKDFSRGKVENQMVSTIDILPTMLSVCGLNVPKNLPGNNLLAVDKGDMKGHQYIHTFVTGSAPSIHYLQFSIRDDRFKLIYNPYRTKNLLAVSRYKNSKLSEDQHVKSFLNPDEYELFDLKNDSYEWKNLAKSPEHQKKKQELIAAMKAFQKEIKDPFLDKKNMDLFEAEQIEHQKINYKKKKGFRWPHLELFEKANR
jgi:N-sulfoglucosamine sulfohydrolase